jgi:hypothetical protein
VGIYHIGIQLWHRAYGRSTLTKMLMVWIETQVPTRRIPLGFTNINMLIWRQYYDGMFQPICVPYWNVLPMYCKLAWIVKIPIMRKWNQKATMPWMYILLHICKHVKFPWDSHPNNMTMLCIRSNGSNAKVISFCKCGWIDRYG